MIQPIHQFILKVVNERRVNIMLAQLHSMRQVRCPLGQKVKYELLDMCVKMIGPTTLTERDV